MRFIFLSVLVFSAVSGRANAAVFSCDVLRNAQNEVLANAPNYSVDVKSGHNGDVTAVLIENDGKTVSTSPLIYMENIGDNNILEARGMRVHVSFMYRKMKRIVQVSIERAGTGYYSRCEEIATPMAAETN